MIGICVRIQAAFCKLLPFVGAGQHVCSVSLLLFFSSDGRYQVWGYSTLDSIQKRVSFLARTSRVLGQDVSSVLRRNNYLRAGLCQLRRVGLSSRRPYVRKCPKLRANIRACGSTSASKVLSLGYLVGADHARLVNDHEIALNAAFILKPRFGGYCDRGAVIYASCGKVPFHRSCGRVRYVFRTFKYRG